MDICCFPKICNKENGTWAAQAHLDISPLLERAACNLSQTTLLCINGYHREQQVLTTA